MGGYLFGGKHNEETDRLRLLGTLYDAQSLRILSASGLSTASDVLEIGPGAGTLVSAILEESRSGRVIVCDLGFDSLDPSLLSLSGVSLVCADASDLPFADDSFDLIHCRMVISHLPSGLSALPKMALAVRAGGCLVVEEIDRTAGRIFCGGQSFGKVRSAISQLLSASSYDQQVGPNLIAYAKRMRGVELRHVFKLPVLSCRPEDPIRRIHALALARFRDDLLDRALVNQSDVSRAVDELARDELVFESSALVSVSLRRID